MAILLLESPFYAESGGQVSDRGEIVGDGWRIDVDEVRKIDGRVVAVGVAQGTPGFGRVLARVPTARRRDTERNHTATHLLHAALRQLLGEHVHQAGSVVEPDRLRFDFTHHGPVRPEQLDEIEAIVNRGIWSDTPVSVVEKSYAEALAQGAMALFGEKYGDVVRVVDIPALSTELCGGTHVRHTGEIGLFRITQETGVAAGVRRIVALTGPRAYEHLRARERALDDVASVLRVAPDQAVRRAQALVDERRQLERRLEEAQRGGGATQMQALATAAVPLGDNARLLAREVQAGTVDALKALGDSVREQLPDGVAVLGARLDDGKAMLVAVVGDALRDRGVRADDAVRGVAALVGGRGGGKPHIAQAGVPDPTRLGEALAGAEAPIRALVGGR